MSYLLREIAVLPSIPRLQPSVDKDDKNERQELEDISLRSSDNNFIPSWFDIWQKYGEKYEDFFHEHKEQKGFFSKLLAAAKGDHASEALSDDEKMKYSKAYIAFVVASLRSRGKVCICASMCNFLDQNVSV